MQPKTIELVQPVFEFLDRLIHDYGDIMYMVFAYAAMALIVWILCGGLRRKSDEPVQDAPPVIFIYLPGSPPPQPPETFDPFPPPREPYCPDCEDRHWD